MWTKSSFPVVSHFKSELSNDVAEMKMLYVSNSVAKCEDERK